MSLSFRLRAALRAFIREMRRPEAPASPIVGVPTHAGVVATPAGAVYQPPRWDPPERAAPNVRLTHKDVGKQHPLAFCNNDEYALCTDEWLSVDCDDCHKKRHAQAPLSDGERLGRVRATGPKTTRTLTEEEIVFDVKHRDLQWRRR